jgi:hypothetical protein
MTFKFYLEKEETAEEAEAAAKVWADYKIQVSLSLFETQWLFLFNFRLNLFLIFKFVFFK